MAKSAAAFAVIKRFIDVDAQQAALALEELEADDAAAILRTVSPTSAAHCLERMQPAWAAALIERLLPDPAGDILYKISPDKTADLFRTFSPETRQKVLEVLPAERRQEVAERLVYPEDSAGRLMKTAEMLAFYKDMKVREVIQRLRAMIQRTSTPSISYSYVVGAEGKLMGVLNMRDLLLSHPEAAIESIMHADVLAVPAFTDREELVHIARNRRYISIPVVDSQGRLIGVIKTEDLLESSEEEATEDLQLMFGVSPEERPFSPLRFKVSKRLPWLYVNLATAFLAAFVVSLFEGLIERMAILAVFLPVVAGMGGNAGTQTLAVTLRGLVTREVRPQDAKKLVLLEVLTGLINGIAVGLVTALACWLWNGNPFLGVVIGLAMVISLIAAGLSGAAIPLAMKILGLDPAHSSGIFLTTVTDVVGFLSFLGLAALFAGVLI